jgi:hypothetical protein
LKTLLIPTDFNPASLNCIPGLLQRYAPEKTEIILVHMMKVTDNIGELLMLSRRSSEYRHISEDFYKACAKLKQQHAGTINNIRIEFFYGSTVAVFKNFLEDNEVDAIVMLEDYNYRMLNNNSTEPALLANRSGCELIYASCNESAAVTAMTPQENLVEEIA